MPASPRSVQLTQLLASARPRHAQMYALTLSGTLEGSGTRWRASYRWQPAETVTQVAPFAVEAAEPYLNIHIRQPIHRSREGAASFDALLDVRNFVVGGVPALFVQRRLASRFCASPTWNSYRPGLYFLRLDCRVRFLR